MAVLTLPGVMLTGNHASRPSSGVGKGTLYACSTHTKIYQTTDTGSTWVDWFTAAASSGAVARTTLGTTSVGGNWETVRGLYVKKITLATDGLLGAIVAHFKGDGTNAGSITPNIYSDTTAAPINILHATPSHTAVPGRLFTLTMNTTGRWISFAVGRWLVAGDYWIGVHMNAASDSHVQLAYAASGSDQTVPTSSINQPTDSSVTAFSTTTRDYSIYADIIR